MAELKRLLKQLRVLLVWDNFESVKEMPDTGGATPPLDEDSCAALKGFLEWVRDHSCSVVVITSSELLIRLSRIAGSALP